MNFYSDDPEWKWMVKNAIDWKTIYSLHYPHYPTDEGFETPQEILSFIEEVFTLVGGWSANSVRKLAKNLDKYGAGEITSDGKQIPNEYLQQLIKEASEIQFFSSGAAKEFGGLDLPAAIYCLNLGILARGDVTAGSSLVMFASIADLMRRTCSKEIQAKWIPKMIQGKASGAMVMTEPDTGSDLGNMKSLATKQNDGSYLLNGTKRFITNAGGGVAFILAKTPNAPEGVAGISMFFGEHILDDGTINFKITKNEEKMGQHGVFTCETVFENSKVYLLGNEGEGLKYMLELMNEARICSGLQGLGAIESALDHALDYASDREAFGKKIKDLPLMKQNLHEYCVERDALRAMLVDTVSYFSIYHHLHLKLIETGELNQEENKLLKKAKKITRLRTPLCKYYGSEAALTLTTKAIQVFGGYGYMKEYPVEKIHRDTFGIALYEGTSQIQALMATKDLLKNIFSHPQKFFQNFITDHPSVQFFTGASISEKLYLKAEREFKMNLLKLLIKCLKPKNPEVLNLKKWKTEAGINQFMTYAEDICSTLSYLQTLYVLKKHTQIDNKRNQLFNDYHTLIIPRLQGIYEKWKIR